MRITIIIMMIFLYLLNCIIYFFSQMLIAPISSSNRNDLNSFRFLLSKKGKRKIKKRKELCIAARVQKAGMFPMHFR